MSNNQVKENISSQQRTKEKLKRPSLYQVVLLNDDFTPMEFVVHVLKKFFLKTEETAHAIMLKIHKEGKGVAGVYSIEVAEMKAEQVNMYSRKNKHPLRTILEEISGEENAD